MTLLDVFIGALGLACVIVSFGVSSGGNLVGRGDREPDITKFRTTRYGLVVPRSEENLD